MKKILLFVGVLVVAIVALGVAGFAYAQSRVPMLQAWTQTPGDDWGPHSGMDGWYGGMHGGRFGGMHGDWYGEGEYGPMHEYMFPAMAEALGISVDELEELHDSGQTMWQIAEELGLGEGEFGELMLTARAKALEQAVGDGVISQEQADWMLERMQQMWDGDGFYGGPCQGGGFGGRGGRGGHWNSAPSGQSSGT
jgi:hypothetical protein